MRKIGLIMALVLAAMLVGGLGVLAKYEVTELALKQQYLEVNNGVYIEEPPEITPYPEHTTYASVEAWRAAGSPANATIY